MSPSTKPSENSGICLVQYWFYTQSIYQRWRWTIDIFRIKGFGNILSHAPLKPPCELLYQDEKTMKKRGMESRKQRLHHRQRSRKVRDNVERSFVPQKRVAGPDRSKRREALGGSIQLKREEWFVSMMSLSTVRGVSWFCWKDWSWLREGLLKNWAKTQIKNYLLQRRYMLHKIENALIVYILRGSAVSNVCIIIRTPKY